MTVGIAHQYKIREAKSRKALNTLMVNDDDFNNNISVELDKAVVKQVSRENAKQIILAYEWLGTMSNTSHHYGIFFNDVCGGVVCYGNNCTANFNVPKEFGLTIKEVWTLARGACVHWTPKGSASKLISQSLKLFKKDVPEAQVVIAYSDTNAGEIGTVYQATNWYYIGTGSHHTVNFYSEDTGRKFDERLLHNLKDDWNCTRSQARDKLLKSGFKIEEKAIKHKYIFLLGSRKEKKQVLSKVTTYPYPKRTD